MDQDEEGEHMANVAFLIRARSVVQVHPGPPFKSPVNTRLFSLFPFRGISLKKSICQLFCQLYDWPDGTTLRALRPFG